MLFFGKIKKNTRHKLKGYLCYNQDVSSEAQVKNFLFCRKVMFQSQDIHGFVFLAIL